MEQTEAVEAIIEDTPIVLSKTVKEVKQMKEKQPISEKQKATLAKAREVRKAKKLLAPQIEKPVTQIPIVTQQEDDYKKHIMELTSRIATLENSLSRQQQVHQPSPPAQPIRQRTIPRF
jgi:hypothetical protein